jgi:hypothetical protein
MNEHPETETLSAYLDGELDGRARSEIERHLQSCAACSAARTGLASAARSVASLGPAYLTVDEHRELRQAILKSRRSTAAKRFGLPQWALAGSLVLVAITVLAFSFLQPGARSPEHNASTQADAGSGFAGGQNFAFKSGDEVDRTVAALPEVRGSSAPGEDSAVSGDYAGAGNSAESAPEAPAKASAPSPEAAGGSGSAPQVMARRDEDAGPFAGDAADECLARIAATQSYPMRALFAGPASFEGRPAWLMVYAWGPDLTEPGPAKQWQAWVVDPDDCRNLSDGELEARALYRSFSPSE